MSFWPFSNSLSSNSQLQKFMDSIQDFSAVTVDDLLDDATLLRELLNELQIIKGNYNNNSTSFQLPQQNQNNETVGATADVVSMTSSNNENSNSNGKDGRGVKLLELLLQPHILNGFLDYIVDSVDFFYKQNLKEQEALEKLIEQKQDEIEDNDNEVENADDQKDKSEDEEVESPDDKFRRCIQASMDILSIELWVILNRIIETPVIMSKLWLILSLPKLQESSPSTAYLVHILDQLMDTNSIELLNFVRRQPNLVDTFLDKIQMPLLTDFFLRIIQTDKADSPTGILEALSLQNLIIKLIDILKPDPSQFVEDSKIPNHELFFKQTAATDFLKALVTISSNTALAVVLETNIGPNQLTRELVSPKIINIMIDEIMLYQVPSSVSKTQQTNKHGINNCVGIIIELIRKNNSDYDLNCGTYSSLLQNGENGTGEINSYVMFQWLKDFDQNPPGTRDPIFLGDMLSIFSSKLHLFSDLIDLPPVPPAFTENKILGFTKFKISELVAELLHCSNMILLNSKKIQKIISIRDNVRLQQNHRLRNALNEKIEFENVSEGIRDVTTGLDDVSLDDIHFDSLSKDPHNASIEDNHYIKSIEALEGDEDSDDDEPTISPENPFVCTERDESIRLNPCIGDLFKIKLIDLGILLNIIFKFTEFPWHNFFHNVVFDLIQQIFNGKLNSYNSFLIVELFKSEKCNLANLIVKSYKIDTEPRPGYMGHLILISEEVVKFTSLYKPDLISPIIVDAILSEDWDWFVTEVLLKTREIYNVVLGAEGEGTDRSVDQDCGFDSSTVGYLDLDSYDSGYSNQKNLILLGDKSNHNLFINDKLMTEDDDDNMEELHMPDVRVQNMSPSGNLNQEIDDEEDQEEYEDSYQDNDFLDDLSGSSSSDDEESSNELCRVPKHNK